MTVVFQVRESQYIDLEYEDDTDNRMERTTSQSAVVAMVGIHAVEDTALPARSVCQDRRFQRLSFQRIINQSHS